HRTTRRCPASAVRVDEGGVRRSGPAAPVERLVGGALPRSESRDRSPKSTIPRPAVFAVARHLSMNRPILAAGPNGHRGDRSEGRAKGCRATESFRLVGGEVECENCAERRIRHAASRAAEAGIAVRNFRMNTPTAMRALTG
ncbi:hypothetical protein ACFV4N_40935, partial [Actinosynnema sp. NPDC059797]